MLSVDVIDRLKTYILDHPPIHNDAAVWVDGMGWDQNKFDPPVFPTAVREILQLKPCLRDHD